MGRRGFKIGGTQIAQKCRRRRREEGRVLIPEKEILIRDFGVRREEEEYYINPSLLKEEKEGDPYAWRMYGYDPQNTGYYPFPLYPPLRFKWLYNWSNFWATMYSGCAAHGILFVPDGSNYVRAFDLETGQTIWRRITTSNTMTCALCVGDSILFVGSLIGFAPERDTTFYALNPQNGQLKWGKVLKTVQNSPIVVDSFVYVLSLGLNKIYCFEINGESIWSFSSGGLLYDAWNSVWWQNKVYHSGGEFNDSLYAHNAVTGEIFWRFKAPSDICYLTICDGKVFFFPWVDTLFAINAQNGLLLLKIPAAQNWMVRAFNKKILNTRGEYGAGDTIFTNAYCLSAESVGLIWHKVLRPRRANGGSCPSAITTKNGVVWIANLDFLYLLNKDSGSVIERVWLPQTNTWEPSGFSQLLIRIILLVGIEILFMSMRQIRQEE